MLSDYMKDADRRDKKLRFKQLFEKIVLIAQAGEGEGHEII